MANLDTEVTIDQLLDVPCAQIAAAFPSFRTVAAHPDSEERAALPACIIEMTEVEPQPGEDAGTGQLPAFVRMEARVMFATRDPNHARELRKAAVSLACWLNLRRWGAACRGDAIRVIACEPDEFMPARDDARVWRVEWVQLVMLGENVWQSNPGDPADADAAPDKVFVGFAPEVGPAHVADYVELAP